MASWPTSLPSPTVEGYGIQPQAAFIRTDMDQGPARQRRRFTTAPTHCPVRWLLTEAQLATLESWFDGSISAGSAWFTVKLRNGQGQQAVDARFIEPWKASLLSGRNYEVTAMLEVRNRPVAAWTGG